MYSSSDGSPEPLLDDAIHTKSPACLNTEQDNWGGGGGGGNRIFSYTRARTIFGGSKS